MKHIKMLMLVIFLLSSIISNAQFQSYKLKGGVQFNGLVPFGEFPTTKYDINFSYLLRGFARAELNNTWDAEFGLGYGLYSGDDHLANHYNTTIIPADVRILFSPFNFESYNPYFYGGFGLLYFNVDDKPKSPTIEPTDHNGLTGIIPFGVGSEFKLSDNLALDISIGINYSLTDNLNYFNQGEYNDGYYNLGIGLTFGGDNPNSDNDMDGLTKQEEEMLGTDPNNSDSDNDGLNDGDEHKKHKTNPVNKDSDDDGLNDKDEVVVHNTNPNKKDSDDDGLSDFDEINKFNTYPTNSDSDKDGLSDGEEINKYKTDPLKLDTDGDMLNDGQEINKIKSNPLVKDTDKGSVDDGMEVKNGTNPLDKNDDIPKKLVKKDVELGIIYFNFDSSKLTKEANETLENFINEISKYENYSIIIAAHTDNIGSDEYNKKLSMKRAESVKKFFVDKGINDNNINAEFFGEENPSFENKSKENRMKNRRAEIKITVEIVE